MIKKKLLKITLITTVIVTILVSSGCGKKTANNDETTVQAVTVSAETSSNAAKELTKTGLVTFEYTDPDGNTYTLKGKAVANETGEAVIEVTDAEGNKVTFTGNAKTVDGKLSVSDIAVKDAGTLVKADGSKIEVTTGAIVADASESTEGGSNSDIAASDDIKQEVETAKKEESVIEAAREEVTKSESNVAANDNVIPEEPKNDTPVTPEEPKQDAQVTPADWNTPKGGMADGTYEFYLFSTDAWHNSPSIYDANDMDKWYGKMIVTIKDGKDECEFYLNLEKVAEKLNCDASDFKRIDAQFGRLGQQWITTAGASSGAWLGLILCVGVTAGVLVRQKKKSDRQVS